MKRKASERIFDFCNMVFLILLAGLTLYPMLYVIFASVSDSNQLLAAKSQGILLHPAGFSLDSYKAVINYPQIWQGYANTLFIVTAGVVINLVMTLTSAYFLVKKGLMFQRTISVLIIFTMFFSGGLIPTYLTIRNLGMLDSIWSVIIPCALNTYNLIIMRTAFYNVPASLCESAEIDGANDLVVLARIMVPVSMPTVAVMILYYGVGHWNSWFTAQIYIQDMTKWPLQLLLRKMLIENGTGGLTGGVSADAPQIGETIKYAIVVVSTLPVLFIYPFLQKYFTAGVMIGAVKG